MEPHKVLSVVSSDVNIMVVYSDERSHEEIPKGISTILAEVGPEAFNRLEQVGKKSVGCLEIIPKQEN